MHARFQVLLLAATASSPGYVQCQPRAFGDPSHECWQLWQTSRNQAGQVPMQSQTQLDASTLAASASSVVGVLAFFLPKLQSSCTSCCSATSVSAPGLVEVAATAARVVSCFLLFAALWRTWAKDAPSLPRARGALRQAVTKKSKWSGLLLVSKNSRLEYFCLLLAM